MDIIKQTIERRNNILNIKDIEKCFSNREPKLLGEYKKSAVMILLMEEHGEEHIIFEVRSRKLRSQPGDICLPGGRIEKGESPLQAALRETSEELNVNQKEIRVIGPMDYFISPYKSIIYPFIGTLKNNIEAPSKDEVEEIFKVPLSYFLKEAPLVYELTYGPFLKDDFPYHLINEGRNYNFSKGKLDQYFYVYKDRIIWGFTAYIVKCFIDLLKSADL
jgi:ADP-ribose pyrophosphatase